MKTNTERLLERIRPLLPDDESYGRLHADLHDLTDACERFLQAVRSQHVGEFSSDDIESLLVDLDVEIDHSLFHLKSAKREIALALHKLAETGDGEKPRSGVG